MNNTNKLCPVCGSRRKKVVLTKNQLTDTQTKYSKPTDMSVEKLALAFCYDCTMLFVVNNLVNIKKNLFGDLYNASLTSITDNEISDSVGTIEILKKYIKKGKILEIGSGRGNFLNLLRNSGFEVNGCEPGNSCFTSRKRYPKIKVIHNIFEPDDYPKRSYDIVVFQNCLEHIPSPRKIIKGVWNILRENGILFIQVPDFTFSLANNIYSDIWFEHVLYFNWDNLELFLNNNNFKILCHESLNEGRDQLIIAKKILSKNPFKKISNKQINKYRNKLDLFVKNFSNYGNKVDNFIDKINKSGKKIIVYGAGASLLSNFSLTKKGVLFLKNRIDLLIDGDKTKHDYYLPLVNIPINPPDALAKKINNPKEFCILICAEKYRYEIYDNIIAILREKAKDVLVYSIFPNFNQIKHRNV